MCHCNPAAGITCGPHFVEGMRRHGEERERRIVLLAESLIAEAEQITRTVTSDTEETP